jgi:hypothetical protein
MLLRLAFSVGLLAVSLFAQSTELTGRVTDPQDQIVPGAKVRLLRGSTQTVIETMSNESGYYVFPNLPSGNYQMTVMRDGFKTAQREGITIATADKRRLDVRLELGAVNETVSVTADAGLLEVSSASVTTTVSSRDYERLPQIQYNRMRSPATFLYLSPGVFGQVSANGRENVAASNQLLINGSPRYGNELYMDGLPGRTNFNETAPPVDAIGEFKLQANNLSAEFGNTGSAVVSFSIKSGTNELRGSVFDIFRNEKLDARSFLAPTRSTIRQNEFGVTVGGPVWLPKIYNGKNKTFFLFSYTGSRKRGLDQIQRRRLPTLAERNGDFSSNVRPLYDPATTRTVGSTFVRDIFPGNRIPTTMLDPVAVEVTKLLPAPNLTGAGVLNYSDFIGEKLLDPDVYLVRGDHAFSQAHRIFGTFNRTKIPRQNITAALTDPLSDRTLQLITSEMIRGNYDWTVKANLLNTFLIGWNNFRNPFQSFFANQGFAAKLGIKGAVGDAFPTFNFSDNYAGLGRNSLSKSTEASLILKNITSYTRGRSVYKIGAEYRLNRPRTADESTTAGNYTFSNLATALPTNPNATGDGYASFLLGRVQSASLNLPFVSNSRKPYWGFFLQDDIRVTPALTLNLGIRYEITMAPTETLDQYALVDLSTPNPAAGNRPGALIFAGEGAGRIGSRRLAETDYSAIGPRVGFAWQLNPATVLRGGYGIFYGDNEIFPVNTGFRVIGNYQSLDQGITFPFNLKDGFPGKLDANPVIGPTILNGQNATYRSGTIGNMPRTQNWSLSVQRLIGSNWTGELSYVGNKNTRQAQSGLINENQLDPKHLALGSVLTQNITSASAVAAGIQRPFPSFTGSVNQALRAYPQYLNLTEQSAKAGASFYNAFTARIRQRYTRGFTFDAHYTFSRNIGYSGSLQDNFNRKLEYGLLAFDIPHSMVISYTYELPFGPGKAFANGNGWYSRLVGGWLINGIQRYQSGSPLNVTVNNTLPIFSRGLRPNVVPGAALSTGISNGDFNANSDRIISQAAFQNPAAFSFGNAAVSYNDLRNFPTLGEDFSIIKNTRITERVNVETSAQFINALNRHRFTDIASNFTVVQSFGQATGSNIGRIITLNLKVKF